MKKKIIGLLLTFAFIGAFFGFAMDATMAYAATDDDEAVEHVVTFDLNGGTYDSYYASFTQTVMHGGLLIEPNEDLIERRNSTFYCWKTLTGVKWDFKKDIVDQTITLFANWNWDDTQGIDRKDIWNGNVLDYLEEKYYLSSGWTMVNDNSTEKVSGYKPIEMKGADTDLFPTSDIEAAIQASGVASSYGGCGPIAMMGMLDFFARYKGYTSITKDPTQSYYRRLLAYDVLTTTKTYEIAAQNAQWETDEEGLQAKELRALQQIESYSGDKATMTLPNDYVSAFNELVKDKYHLGQQIQAHNQGAVFVGLDQKINRVKQSIDAGIPVTVYSAAYGDGNFADHYVNVFGYEDWHGVDRFGNAITNVVFLARYNWGKNQSYIAYMDSTMLIGGITGVIYYTVKDNNQLIRPSDFAKDFVNENGQGQYYFDEKTKYIITADNFAFLTTRLRCSYIENEYLVLSANRENAGLAYLKMQFSFKIKAMNFDISAWSKREGLDGSNDYVKLFFLNSEEVWQEAISFTSYDLSGLKASPKNMYIEFAEPSNIIKFEVYKASPSGDRNKGRVIIGDMNIFF